MSIRIRQSKELERRIEEKKKEKVTGKKRGRPRKNKIEEEIKNPPFMPFDETGEIPAGYIPGLLKEGSSVTDKEALKKQRERQEAQRLYEESLEKKDPFAQTGKEYSAMSEKLTQAELHYLMQIIHYVPFGEKPIKKDGKLLTIGDMHKIWGVSRQTASRYINKYIKLGIAKKEKSKTSKREEYLVIKKEFWFKGNKNFKGYSSKVMEEKMEQVIESIKIQVAEYLIVAQEEENKLAEEQKREPKEIKNCFPLSLLGVLIAHIHFQTFFLVHNPTDIAILEGETVEEVMDSEYKSTQRPGHMKFMSKIDIWRKITGKKVKELETEQSQKLDLYFQMLLKAGALISIDGMENRLIMHPELAFVTPRVKDTEWYKFIEKLFKITKSHKDKKDKKKTTKKQG
ncbi:TPA: MarR family transcriptional regulator [Bacillus pacificus]